VATGSLQSTWCYIPEDHIPEDLSRETRRPAKMREQCGIQDSERGWRNGVNNLYSFILVHLTILSISHCTALTDGMVTNVKWERMWEEDVVVPVTILASACRVRMRPWEKRKPASATFCTRSERHSSNRNLALLAQEEDVDISTGECSIEPYSFLTGSTISESLLWQATFTHEAEVHDTHWKIYNDNNILGTELCSLIFCRPNK
jgi:hypothetical protein